jgi:hypothetical protein
MRLTQISHILNLLGIATIPHQFSDSQSLIVSITNRIYLGTAVANIATMYYLGADMVRAGEIDLSYVPTAEMHANCFTKPLMKLALLKQCAVMRMIKIRLGNGLGTLGNICDNGIGIGIRHSIGYAVAKQIDSMGMFVSRRSMLLDRLLFSFDYCCVGNGCDCRPGGVFS